MSLKQSKSERTGVLLNLLASAFWGLFPVLVNRGTQTIPPLFFAACATIFTTLGTLIYVLSQGTIHELKNRKTYFPLFMVALCIIIIPYPLFFLGSKMTSGVNSSFLLLSEIPFTLFFTPFIGEKTTLPKLLGALGIFFGAFFMMYKGSWEFNPGDLLIILSTAAYPIGNFYGKKALKSVSPSVILLVRSMLGWPFLLLLSTIFEGSLPFKTIFTQHWELILFQGMIVLGLTRILWYESLKRLDISKSVALGMTFPLFSLLILFVYYGETISKNQWIGMVIMMIGVYVSIKRPSIDPSLTKYR